jgi:hypothetical protein
MLRAWLLVNRRIGMFICVCSDHAIGGVIDGIGWHVDGKGTGGDRGMGTKRRGQRGGTEGENRGEGTEGKGQKGRTEGSEMGRTRTN